MCVCCSEDIKLLYRSFSDSDSRPQEADCRVSSQETLHALNRHSFLTHMDSCCHKVPRLRLTPSARLDSRDYSVTLVPNSTTRIPTTDMLYNTTNGQAHNSCTTCCTTNLPHRNARVQHLDMSRCWGVANFCPFVVNLLYNKLQNCCSVSVGGVVNMSVVGVRVVEFGTYAA